MAPARLLHPQVDEDLYDVGEKIHNGQYRPNAGSRRLWSSELISNVWPGKPPDNRLHILVGMTSPTLVYDGGGGKCVILLFALSKLCQQQSLASNPVLRESQPPSHI